MPTVDHLGIAHVSFEVHHFDPSSNDWIGVYCLEGGLTDSPDEDYVDWRRTDGLPADTYKFGPLINMRCAWQFRYFHRIGNNNVHQRMGISKVMPSSRGDSEPLQVHLALTGDPASMRVMWISADVLSPVVRYGTAADNLDQQAVPTASTYHASDLCEAPANIVGARGFRNPGMIFDAVMVELEPHRVYFYQVGSEDGGFSDMFHFRSPVPPGATLPPAMPTSFFVLADLGEWTPGLASELPRGRSGHTMELIADELKRPDRHYAAVLHDGDLSYARGVAYQWEQFSALIQPVATQIPYMVAVGNHEYCYLSGGIGKDPSGSGATNGWHPAGGNYAKDSLGECGIPTARRFHMPENGNGVFWYSFDVGLMHHVVISSEHDWRPQSPMIQWLQDDLRRVDRDLTPWLFVHLHRPLYCSERFVGDNTVSLLLQANLEDLFFKYRVHVVFSGHFHAYERTCPVYNALCRSHPEAPTTAGAPVHIMVGSAGAKLDYHGFDDVLWSAAHRMEYGYGRMHVHNSTHALFEFQRNEDSVISDSAWVVSTHDW
ncbi:TPA: hypothetical protein N0F65_003194 [Lagenidium giganteum]|uniref:Purple acid phosphatase n=1 Tax=Lagenidium giganteum TaxID=4803 RepID=A0AAV2Z9M2_9STRA|nr:TPA: hypothetical protein N0F65_003194 [Lagenidium giganteum]